VLSLAATASLKGKEKKAHEAKKIVALGGKEAKKRSIPYKTLIGMKTKGVERKQRREDLVRRVMHSCCGVGLTQSVTQLFGYVQLKESDVVTGKRKSSGKSRDEQKRKKVDFGLQATKGRFKRGVLDVRGL
jgi:hypothetical protein